MEKNDFMKIAIDLATDNVRNGGGPFGAVIVRNGEIVATGVNRVTSKNDPTAHAEVTAIRSACEKLSTFDLEGFEIYSSCEPCPMCLGAIYWAHLSHLYFAGTQHDAAKVGFDDAFIYDELEKDIQHRHLPTVHVNHTESLAPFNEWSKKSDKIEY